MCFLLQAIIYEGQDKNPEMCRVLLTHEIMCRWEYYYIILRKLICDIIMIMIIIIIIIIIIVDAVIRRAVATGTRPRQIQ